MTGSFADVGSSVTRFGFCTGRLIKMGGCHNFERRNVERLKFRNFKIANIKITKGELFDGFIFEFFFHFFRYYLDTQNI